MTKNKVEELKGAQGDIPEPQPQPLPGPEPPPEPPPESTPDVSKATIRLVGTIPPEVWNRFGTKVLPRLRSENDLTVGIDLSASVSSQSAQDMENELQRVFADLGLSDWIRVEWL